MNDTTIYEDDSLCVESESRIAQNSNSLHNRTINEFHYRAIPNPFESKVKIICDNCKHESFDFIIYDFLGHIIKPNIINNEIDMNNFSPGIYFITLWHENEIAARIKIVKTP